MNEKIDKKPRGKAIVIEADTEPPTAKGIKAMQDLVRRVGLGALGMLEAETYGD